MLPPTIGPNGADWAFRPCCAPTPLSITRMSQRRFGQRAAIPQDPPREVEMDQNPLRTTMMALIYPAVHGAGLVWLVSKWVEIGSPIAVATEPRSYLALWLILFFGVSYIVINAAPPEKYTWEAFTLDFLEIILVFLCFAALGYVKPGPPSFSWAFGLLAIVPIVQSLWNHAMGRTRLWKLSIVTTAVCLSVAFSTKNCTGPVYVGIIVLYILLIKKKKKKRYVEA